MLHNLIAGWYGETTYSILYWTFRLYPLWLPFLLGIIFWEVWVRYIRYLFFSTTKTVVLEIRLPKEITRSPLAMEVVLTSLYQTGSESTFLARYWEGKTRAWFSLEIVSDGGEVRFLIWTRENMRNLIESQIYSQFPEVEVHQVEDYATKMDYKPGETDMWACRYELTQDDPLPIMSYIDYGLHQNPKEEQKVDPLTTVLEFLSTLKQGENIWFQIGIRAHKNEKREGFFSKGSDWLKRVSEVRAKFIQGLQKEGRLPATAENQIMDALQREFQKFPFDVCMRCIYIAEKNVFNLGVTGGLRGLLRPFSFNSLGKFGTEPEKGKFHFAGFNGFKPVDTIDQDYPWEDFMGFKLNYQKRKMLDAYKRRMFFYTPYPEKTFVMTTEGLATIYHFPGSSAAAPGLKRIPSKRGQAPTNLPV